MQIVNVHGYIEAIFVGVCGSTTSNFLHRLERVHVNIIQSTVYIVYMSHYTCTIRSICIHTCTMYVCITLDIGKSYADVYTCTVAHSLPLSIGIHHLQQLVNELLNLLIREQARVDNVEYARGRKCLHCSWWGNYIGN